LFSLNKNDPMYAAKLEQQTILIEQLENRAQSTIVNKLTDQFIVNTTKASEAAGSNRIDIAAQSFAEGDMTADQYHDLMGDTNGPPAGELRVPSPEPRSAPAFTPLGSR
jgi:hypothetical protein